MRHAEIYKVVLRAIDAERRRNKELAKNPHFDQGTTIAYASAARTCTDVKRAVSRAIRAIPTTPNPSADAVRELVLLSRGLAKRTFNRSTAEMYIHFADKLESLPSGGSHA